MSQTRCVYKYVYLCVLTVIKQQPSSYANKIEDKFLFKVFNLWKGVSYPVKNGKIISAYYCLRYHCTTSLAVVKFLLFQKNRNTVGTLQ